MTRQESTYYPDTYQMRDFKEFFHGQLMLHEKYDADGSLSYRENEKGKGSFQTVSDECGNSDRFKIGFWEEYESIDEENSSIIVFGKYINGKREGIWTVKYDSGELLIEAIDYTNDMLNGEVKTLFKDGNLRTISNYSDNRLNGKYSQFNNNGSIKLKGFFLNDSKEGDWDVYDEDGVKIETKFYKNGNEIVYI